jgi:hypothetical protein
MIEFLLSNHLDKNMNTIHFTDQELLILQGLVSALPESDDLRKKLYKPKISSGNLPNILQCAIDVFVRLNPHTTITAFITNEAPPLIEGGSRVEVSGDFKMFTNYFRVWEGTQNEELTSSGLFFYKAKRGNGCCPTIEEALSSALKNFI